MDTCSIKELIEPSCDGRRRIIAFCGAGGKTSDIHAVRDCCLAGNRKVLVTTTTHMFLEEGCVSDEKEIIEKLDREGYAFAGLPTMHGSADNKTSNLWKIRALPDDVRRLAQSYADVTLIEADGARCLPFKVPKPWEPVIPEETTDVVLVMGMDAERRKICEICYNPEGVAEALGVSTQTCLTREMMIEAYMNTYVRLIRERFGNARVFLHMNEKTGQTVSEFFVLA